MSRVFEHLSRTCARPPPRTPLPTPARAIIPPPRRCVRGGGGGGSSVVPAEAGTHPRRSREGGNPSPSFPRRREPIPVVPAEAGTHPRRSREGGNPSPVCTGTTMERGGTLTGPYICATLPSCQSPAPGPSPHRLSGPRHTVSHPSHTRSRPGHAWSHLTPLPKAKC